LLAPLAAVIAAAGLAACGGKADRKGPAFHDSGVGFSFRYPHGFKVQTADRGSVLALVSLDPLNGLAIRSTSPQALVPDQFLGQLRADFQRQGFHVVQRRERHSGLDMGVLAFTIPRSNPASGGRTPLRTVNYFFAGGGKTWQLECRSTTRTAQVDGACREAIDSISFG
jgi:hypothetical protein